MIGNLVGSYKITDKIGEGGMGAVFRGIDVMLEREVAVKMLRPELSQQPNIVERFRSEAVTLAKLNHPNIATLYSFVRQGDDFFMVMEFVRGETLDGLIRRSGVMPCDKAIGLMCQALEGIDHAHKMGIIHRDVKPANMMMTEGGTLKVMDFGIARVLGTARMTKQGNIVGTIEYMSPEQVRGQDTDARSDIYSLGILLYEMLTGRVPFSSDSEFDLMKMQIDDAPQPPRVFSAQIPQAVEQAIMRSLAKKPEARFQSAAEFRDALRAAGGAAVAPTVSVTPTAPPTRLGEANAQSPGSVAALKETRLGANPPAGFQADQMKATRLGGEGNAPLAYGAAGSAGGYQQATPIPVPVTQSGTKVVVGIVAALLLVVVVGVSVILLTSGKKESPIPGPVVTQPTQPVTSAPVVNQPSLPSQPPPQLESAKPAPDGLGGAAMSQSESPNTGKPAKSSRKDNSADADAAARKEKARKAAEARRLLDQ